MTPNCFELNVQLNGIQKSNHYSSMDSSSAFLSHYDNEQLKTLRDLLVGDILRTKRGINSIVFSKKLQLLKDFCLQGNSEDIKRCIACGIIWIPNGVFICVQRLSQLLGKCKSSVNGSFRALGYMNINSQKIVSKHLSYILSNYSLKGVDLKEWSVRISLNRNEPPVCNVVDPLEKYVTQASDFFDIIDSPEFDFASMATFTF